MTRAGILCVCLLCATATYAAAPPTEQDYVEVRVRGRLFIEEKPANIDPLNWGEGTWNDVARPLIQVGEGRRRVLYAVRYDDKHAAAAKKLDGKKVILTGDLSVSGAYTGINHKPIVFRVITVRSIEPAD